MVNVCVTQLQCTSSLFDQLVRLPILDGAEIYTKEMLPNTTTAVLEEKNSYCNILNRFSNHLRGDYTKDTSRPDWFRNHYLVLDTIFCISAKTGAAESVFMFHALQYSKEPSG